MAVLDDIKRSFNRGDSMVRKLIIVNLGVFVLIHTVRLVFWAVTGKYSISAQELWLYMPSDLGSFVQKPWTLFTYMFTHTGFFHLLFNLLMFWYLGSLFSEYLGNKKLLQVYFWGGITGGLFYLAGMNLIPMINRDGLLLGASASVLAVIAGIATLLPNYEIRFFILDLKLKYIAIAAVLISFFSIPVSNAGGNLAHVGGAIFGFLYVKQMQRVTVLDRVGSWVKKKMSPVLRMKKDERKYYSSYTLYMKTRGEEPKQEEVDAVLDKINSSGYQSLTRAEREILFKASQQD